MQLDQVEAGVERVACGADEFVADPADVFQGHFRGASAGAMDPPPWPSAMNTWALAWIGEGAIGASPPACSERCDMRPTCQSCAAISPPAACTASVTWRQPASCASL